MMFDLSMMPTANCCFNETVSSPQDGFILQEHVVSSLASRLSNLKLRTDTVMMASSNSRRQIPKRQKIMVRRALKERLLRSTLLVEGKEQQPVIDDRLLETIDDILFRVAQGDIESYHNLDTLEHRIRLLLVKLLKRRLRMASAKKARRLEEESAAEVTVVVY